MKPQGNRKKIVLTFSSLSSERHTLEEDKNGCGELTSRILPWLPTEDLYNL